MNLIILFAALALASRGTLVFCLSGWSPSSRPQPPASSAVRGTAELARRPSIHLGPPSTQLAAPPGRQSCDSAAAPAPSALPSSSLLEPAHSSSRPKFAASDFTEATARGSFDFRGHALVSPSASYPLRTTAICSCSFVGASIRGQLGPRTWVSAFIGRPLPPNAGGAASYAALSRPAGLHALYPTARPTGHALGAAAPLTQRTNTGRQLTLPKRAAAAGNLGPISPQAVRTRLAAASDSADSERLAALQSIDHDRAPVFQDPAWTPAQPLVEIKNLHVVALDDADSNAEIIRGVSLKIYVGQTHAIMGRNGSGKSTLSKIIAGHPAYKITKGSIFYKGLDLSSVSMDHRSIIGIFLAFQYPIEIPMVRNSELMRLAINERRKWKNEPDIDPFEFIGLMTEKLREVGLSSEFLDRPVNFGFSGGEKKRNEIMQMLLLEPTLVMLDETDSGLDVDSLQVTIDVVKKFASPSRSFLVVSHYSKVLEMLQPSNVHIMHGGRILRSGGMELAHQIDGEGFHEIVKQEEGQDLDLWPDQAKET
eukprot:GHVT01078145.1.p1 GENE.GHVT01078145.1~~GHVT01078145.1.p1  ORF type:complete len:538 (+),score=100.69 GHVT01078145.1:268-1881(+)